MVTVDCTMRLGPLESADCRTAPIGSFDHLRLEEYQEVLNGAEKPSLTGTEVYQFLEDETIRCGFSRFKWLFVYEFLPIFILVLFH